MEAEPIDKLDGAGVLDKKDRDEDLFKGHAEVSETAKSWMRSRGRAADSLIIKGKLAINEGEADPYYRLLELRDRGMALTDEEEAELKTLREEFYYE